MERIELTTIQKRALELMRRRDAGAIRTRIGWVWRSDVRLSVEAAEAIVLHIAENEKREDDR